jgi:hypothetical protein
MKCATQTNDDVQLEIRISGTLGPNLECAVEAPGGWYRTDGIATVEVRCGDRVATVETPIGYFGGDSVVGRLLDIMRGEESLAPWNDGDLHWRPCENLLRD